MTVLYVALKKKKFSYGSVQYRKLLTYMFVAVSKTALVNIIIIVSLLEIPLQMRRLWVMKGNFLSCL